MARYAALPHQYRARVYIQDVTEFAEDYGDQASNTDRLTIMTPSNQTLSCWAKSCMTLGEFTGMHFAGGWSPFRSAEVRVERDKENSDGTVEQTFYYKLGDDGRWDFETRLAPDTFPLKPWLATLKTFVRVALWEYVRASDPECVLAPPQVVRKMMYREWGSAGDAFTRVLNRACFGPNAMDDMIRDAWRGMVRLPVPATFKFVAQDHDVQNAVVGLAASKIPHGLRV